MVKQLPDSFYFDHRHRSIPHKCNKIWTVTVFLFFYEIWHGEGRPGKSYDRDITFERPA